jgi:hypothetical protein
MVLFRMSGPRVLLMCEQLLPVWAGSVCVHSPWRHGRFSPWHQLTRFFMHAHNYCRAYRSAELQSAMLDSVQPIYRRILKESLRTLPRDCGYVIGT